VPVFRLIGSRSVPRPQRGITGLFSPLVGRAAELSLLQSALTELGGGRGGRIAVLGEAGLGKSRLVAEARAAFGAGVTWIEGRAISCAQTVS
jgi:hypothetical protein